MKKEKNTNKEPSTVAHKTMTVIGIILCVILVPILIINCTLIVKSIVNKDEVPNLFGMTPLIVDGDSMYDTIHKGDIIIVRKTDPAEIAVGDVISYFDPEAKNENAVTTHRVIKIEEKDGVRFFYTQGDNKENSPDILPKHQDDIVGVWMGTRFAGAGAAALFMQSAPGYLLCVALPLVLLVAYDVVRRKIYDKKNKNDVDALMAELEALKAEKAKQAEQPEQKGEQMAEQQPENTEAPTKE